MMNEEIKLTTENAEETSKENVETQAYEEKADATMATENETPVQGESEGFIDKALDIWDIVKLCCYFVPIITTVAAVLSFSFELPDFVENYIIVPMTFAGWIAALLTGPIRLIKLFLKVNLWGFKTGFNLIPFFPICFLSGGMLWALCFAAIGYTLLFAPAVITIFFFFRDEF